MPSEVLPKSIPKIVISVLMSTFLIIIINIALTSIDSVFYDPSIVWAKLDLGHDGLSAKQSFDQVTNGESCPVLFSSLLFSSLLSFW